VLHAAAAVPASAVRGTAANSAVSVGLIGCGNRGTFLGQLVTEHTQARLTALCDIYPESMARARTAIGRSNVTEFRDMEKLLASGVDAVLLATPLFLHPEHFETVTAAHKHVYIEKPAASDVAGCRRIEKAAVGVRDRDLCFGFQRRYGRVYLAANRVLQDGRIGSIRMASIRFIKSGASAAIRDLPEPKSLDEKIKNWYHWRRLSGDLIVENNCHLIDVMNWFLGGCPDAAAGEGGRTVRRSGDIRDHGTVTYQYPGSVQGTLCGTTLSPEFHRDVREEYFGAEGWLETSENGWRYQRSATDTAGERSPRNISIDSIAAFVKRVESGNVENTIARGVESSLTAILGRLAMDLRRPVTWSEMLASNGWPG
jgi:myo-inositol 2-dehydrogenase/D-chiro-inositol 1-dehydrogenase